MRLSGITTILASILLAAPLYAQTPQADAPAAAAEVSQPAVSVAPELAKPEVATGPAKVVFDTSHGEIFSPVKKGPLHYSDFTATIRKTGAKVSMNAEAISLKALEGVDTYIIAGPSKPVSRDEIAALSLFVQDGGNLLVLMHISPPVAQLTESFGILVSNFVIAEHEGTIKGKSQDFYVAKMIEHPVTAGVGKIAVFGSWGLMAEGEASVLASTSEKAWMDLNRNRAFDHGEPIQSYGIVAAANSGAGKVVVVADDAPFANKFMKEAGNRRLAQNIIAWFSAKK